MSAPVRHRSGRGSGRGRCSLLSLGQTASRLLCPRPLSGVELPVALFDAASALVPGNGGADVVWASPFARCGDLLLRLARCQNEDPITEGWRRALAVSRGALASAGSRWSGRLRCCRRLLHRGHLFCQRARAVACEDTFRGFQFAELATEFLALRIDTRERLADPLLLLSDLFQCGHSVPSRQSMG